MTLYSYCSEKSDILCKSNPYINPLYDIQSLANVQTNSKPSVDQQDVGHGVESESNIYEDLQEIGTARPVCDIVSGGHYDQEIICNTQATDQENLYNDILYPLNNNMPESEIYDDIRTPASGIILHDDEMLPKNDPENLYDDIHSPIADAESEDIYEEIEEDTHGNVP